MTNRSKAKGTDAERKVVEYLSEVGAGIERRAQHGSKDRGDISGLIGTVVEVKSHREIKLAEFVDQALAERDNADASLGFAWIKRPGKGSPADWYCVLDGRQMRDLLVDTGRIVLKITSEGGDA